MPEAESYTIRVRGHLDPHWSEWFEDMTMTHTDDGDTILHGPVADQAALHGLAAEWSAGCGVVIQLDLPPDASLRPWPGEVTVNLYRVVQEALTNITHHAGASTVAIRLAWEGARLVLTVQDNGHGFHVPANLADLTTQGHFGLAGMAERASLIGGAMAVTSAPGQGTTIRVECEATEAK